MNLHCEVLYDSLNASKDQLHGNDIAVIRTDSHTLFLMTDGVSQSATNVADKVRHLLSFHPSSIKSWESLCRQLMSWGEDWTHLIAMVDYNFSTRQSMFLERLGYHVCLHRQYRFIPFPRQEIQHNDAVFSLALLDAIPDDLITIYRSSTLWDTIGHHLTWGWQHDFGLNSEMLLKDRQPCVRMFLNDIMVRINRLHQTQSSLVGIFHIREPKQAIIMLGPPSHADLDEHVVNTLMSKTQAIKIVCGGTTSEIVSRCLNKRLITIPTSSTDIPPLSMIEGIDLVTEGVLTLHKTIELLELLNTMPSLVLTFHDAYQYDGAFHLTRLLCSSSTHIHFLIGLARNEDHEYRQDICFQTKSKLGQQLIALLVQMGKHVTVEYH